MINSAIVIVCAFFLINTAHSEPASIAPSIKVHLVDSTNAPFPAEVVRWRYRDNAKKSVSLACASKQCSEWTLNKLIDKPIIIRASASVVLEDADCWQLYQGEALINKPNTSIKIVMHSYKKVCR